MPKRDWADDVLRFTVPSSDRVPALEKHCIDKRQPLPKWELIEPTEIRGDPEDGLSYFRLYPASVSPSSVDGAPILTKDELLVLLFLRRYVRYGARRRRFAQMEGAARLARSLVR